MAEQKGTCGFGKYSGFFLFVTAFEVLLGILKVNGSLPETLVYGNFWFILANARIYSTYHYKSSLYCNAIAHLGHEVSGLKLTILLPVLY